MNLLQILILDVGNSTYYFKFFKYRIFSLY